jgi:hypothetical protein
MPKGENNVWGKLPTRHTMLFGNDGTVINTLNGALNVHQADVHLKPVSRYALNEQNTVTLASPASAGDRVLSLVSAAGLSVGEAFRIEEGFLHEERAPQIIGISVNDVTIDQPLDNDYTVAADILQAVSNAALFDGSVTPVSFKVRPIGGEDLHVVRIIPTWLSGTSMDDGRYGGIAALLRGTLLRRFDGTTGKFRTITNWKRNIDFIEDAYDLRYSEKAPAGQFGAAGRMTFKKFDTVVELKASAGDYLEILIQDSMLLLDDHQFKYQIHEVTG